MIIINHNNDNSNKNNLKKKKISEFFICLTFVKVTFDKRNHEWTRQLLQRCYLLTDFIHVFCRINRYNFYSIFFSIMYTTLLLYSFVNTTVWSYILWRNETTNELLLLKHNTKMNLLRGLLSVGKLLKGLASWILLILTLFFRFSSFVCYFLRNVLYETANFYETVASSCTKVQKHLLFN